MSENNLRLVPEPSTLRPPQQDPTKSMLESREMTLAVGPGQAEVGQAALAPAAGSAPTQLGLYQLLEKLGEGGMGAVYKARHTRLNKLVAIKLLPAQMTRDPAAVARFDREMQAVGALEHPNIARAMDAGEADGTHYLAMEFVDGQDLQQIVKKRGRLSVVSACKLIRQTALALDYAHRHGLVHRDIKPSNLILNKAGQIKVLDLGLARLAQDEGQQELTTTGTCMGTPDYMAPEQWEDAHAVDSRCDLYALGCTLFYLLIGRAPFGDEKHSSTFSKMKAHATEPIPNVRELRPELPKELAALCTALLAKSPADRPADAKTVAERLAPFCKSSAGDGETQIAPSPAAVVVSEPLTTMEGTVAKTVIIPAAAAATATVAAVTVAIQPVAASAKQPPRDRRRLPLALAGGAALLILLGAIIIKITNKDGTVTEIKVPEGSKVEIVNADEPERPISSPKLPIEKLKTRIANLKSRIANAPDPRGTSSHTPSDAPSDAPPQLPPMSAHALVARPVQIPGLRSWSIELAGSHNNNSFAIAASPNGETIATGSMFGKISLWTREGKYQRPLLAHGAGVNSLDFSPDGRLLASCEMMTGLRGYQGYVRVWNLRDGLQKTAIPVPNGCYKVAFSPNSEQLAIAVCQSPLMLHDLQSGQTVSCDPIQDCQSVAWSPDGAQLACYQTDRHLRVWDVKSLQIVREVEAPVSQFVEWSPDGKSIATGTADLKVAIRDSKTLAVSKTLGSEVFAVAWFSDSRRIVAGSSGVFDAATGEALAAFPSGELVRHVALVNKEMEVVFETSDRMRFFDTSTGKLLREGSGVRMNPARTILASNGRQVLAPDPGPANPDSKVRLFDAATGERLKDFTAPHPWPGGNLVIQTSPDASLCAIAASHARDPSIVIADFATGEKLHELRGNTGNVTHFAWSADGKWLASGATDNLVRVWNAATGKIEHELAGHTAQIGSLAWSPDGTRLASSADDKSVRLWNPVAANLVASFNQFPEPMSSIGNYEKRLVWTSDSRRLWIALSRNILTLEVETGTFSPPEDFSNGGHVTFINLSPDSQRLLAREGSNWTYLRGQEAQDRRPLGRHLGLTAQWHPDSHRFLGWEPSFGTIGFDVENNRRLGLLFPFLPDDHWLCLGPTGHYRGSPGVESHLVYVALLNDGTQRTFTPAAFAVNFRWKNDPEQATLLGP